MPPWKPNSCIRSHLCTSKSVLCSEFLVFGTHVIQRFKNEIFVLKRVDLVLFFMLSSHEMIKHDYCEEGTVWMRLKLPKLGILQDLPKMKPSSRGEVR